MTREEAIFILRGKRNIVGEKTAEALDIAIKAIEQEPCEDVISREELLKAIDTWDKFGCDANTKLVPYQDHYIPYIHYDDVIKCIKGMPSVISQPQIGHWIKVSNGTLCSICRGYAIDDEGLDRLTDYCPWCGAKMQEVEQ